MSIATVVGAWTAGSLLLGLLLGRLFRFFAARRHAEENLFAWLEGLRLLVVRQAPHPGSRSVRHIVSFVSSTSMQEWDGDEEKWVSYLEANPRGRMIQ